MRTVFYYIYILVIHLIGLVLLSHFIKYCVCCIPWIIYNAVRIRRCRCQTPQFNAEQVALFLPQRHICYVLSSVYKILQYYDTLLMTLYRYVKKENKGAYHTNKQLKMNSSQYHCKFNFIQNA